MGSTSALGNRMRIDIEHKKAKITIKISFLLCKEKILRVKINELIKILKESYPNTLAFRGAIKKITQPIQKTVLNLDILVSIKKKGRNNAIIYIKALRNLRYIKF